MSIISRPSPVALTAIVYITVGALLDVWSGIWYSYLRHHPPASEATFYVCDGFILTGLTLIVIGLTIGRIGRNARHAELPPDEVTTAVERSEQTAAARAPIVGGTNPAVQNPPPAGPSPAIPVAEPVNRLGAPVGANSGPAPRRHDR